jgi:hypothetical protein
MSTAKSLTLKDYVRALDSTSKSISKVESDSMRAIDLMELIASLRSAYPVTSWREEQARRLQRFLSIFPRFTREELRNWLYRETFMLEHRWRLRRREAPFMKKLIRSVLENLSIRGYIRTEKGYYSVINVPSYNECLSTLTSQIYRIFC